MKNGIKYGVGFILFLLLASQVLFAQSNRFGNEWIDFNNTYYSIPVAQNGIYKVSYEDMQSVGIPIASIPPANLQLWHRGQQVAIQTVNATPSTFAPGDYILFYGIKNDGWQDSSLYISPDMQPHKLLSLFSDTTRFFLTWASGFSKRMVINNNPALSNQFEAYHINEELKIYSEDYSVGTSNDLDPRNSFWEPGEGWCSIRYDNTGAFTQAFAISSVKPGSFNVSGILYGRNSSGNSIQINDVTQTSSPVGIGNVTFNGNSSTSFSFDFNNSNTVGSINLGLIQQTSGASYSLGYLRLSYPQAFDMTGLDSKIFNLIPNSSNFSSVKISHVPSNSQVFDITDYKNVIAINSTQTGPSELTFSVQNSSTSRKILVTAAIYRSSLKSASFRTFVSSAKTFVILTNKALMKPYGASANVIKDYAAYRYSTLGGSYDTLVADVEQIFDQFGYGEANPLAIRKFCDFLTHSPSIKPASLLIIGKGIDVSNYNARFKPSALIHSNLVPTFGNPGSDILFSAGLDNAYLHEPAIPTGRISAYLPEEVLYYLNKLKTFEATPFELWRKNMVHLSGGAPDIGTMNSIAGFMDIFAQTASGPLLGAKITSLQKRTDAVYQLFDLSNELKEGLLVINAFGHAATFLTELDIGYPSDPALGYPENGKYPLVIINGCDAGNAFEDESGSRPRSIGEDWTLTPNKGAIATMAHVHKGYVHTLGAYGKIFYRLAFADSVYFSRTLGEIQRETNRQFAGNISETLRVQYFIAQSQQMLLLGDPAIVLFGPNKADYATADASVFIKSYTNNAVEAETDSFALGVIVSNLGRGINDSIGVCVTRTLPDGSVINYSTQLFKPVLNKDTVYFKIYFRGESSFGINNFTVTLNCGNKIQELDFSNNSGSIQYFMSKKSVICLMPQEFSIVSSQPVSFVAQTTNQLSSDSRQFFYEVDTSAHFNSAFKKMGIINGNSLAEWKLSLLPDISSNDSIVYYWRVRSSDPTPGQVIVWTNSSFLYIKNSPSGWSQSKFDQFYKLNNQGVVKDTVNRKWAFQNSSFKLKITALGAPDNIGSPLNSDNAKQVFVGMNGQTILTDPTNSCSDFGWNGVYSFAIDQYNFQLKQINPTDDRGQFCKQTTSGNAVNKFLINGYASSNSPTTIIQSFQNVTYGDFIVFFNVGNAAFGSSPVWTPALKQALAELGAKNFDKLKEGWPYILVARKGLPSQAIEMIPDTNNLSVAPRLQPITLDSLIKINSLEGAVVSPEFGPASSWGNLFYKTEGNDAGAQDLFSMLIVGKTANNLDTTLYSGNPTDGMDVSWISASKFPKLRLRAYFKDTVNVTPIQLKKWQLIYQPVPEGTLVFNSLPVNTYDNISKLEGDSLKLPFYFKNISNIAFKAPLVVNYTVVANSQKYTKSDTLKTELKPDSIWALPRYGVNTFGLSGLNNFQVYVNPKLQLEQYYPNNFYSLFFNVQKDNKNPVLDVAFDGVHIMNGDIVSPSPVITINMNDDNPYLLKKDTVGIDLLIKNCQEQSCNFERISLLSPDVTYAPATNARNKFQITYHPKNLTDGTYTLRLQAEDATGNKAGIKPYQINFEVVNQSAITNFFPYPNPFSTHTRFAYTLTGGQIPDEVKIQIMTVAGKVVREVLQGELGQLTIGTHLTDFVWDGTDEFGDKLANGVYFYKVFARSSGKDMEKRSTSADKAFTESFGKMYILR